MALTPQQQAANIAQNVKDWYGAAYAPKPVKKPSQGELDYWAKAGAPAQAPSYNPWGSLTYLSTKNQADAQYGVTAAKINNQVANNTSDIGADANGNINYSNIDVTNPFSKAALLQRNFNQQQARDTNSYAAQGQQRSGAMIRQRANTQFGFEQGQDQLQKSLSQMLAEANLQRSQADVDRGGAISAGLLASINGAPSPY
jgi:hypothetical protein